MKRSFASAGLLALSLALGSLSPTPAFAAKATKAKKTTIHHKTKAAPSKSPIVLIRTTLGNIKVRLNEAKAPISTKNFLTYVKEKHYDGTIFHRVIPDFMIQGGGMLPSLKEKGGTHAPIHNESNNGLKNNEGTIAMARTNDPDSATDQFFINVKDNDFLNFQSAQQPGYAVFGKVISGMNVVHKIEHVPTTTKPPYENVPKKSVVIKSIRVVKK